MTEPLRRPPPGAVLLAREALRAALAEDWPAARVAVQAVSDQYEEDGVATLIYGLCDTVALRQGIPQGDGSVIVPSWLVEGETRVTGPDDVSAPARWAGRLLAARIAMDRETCHALILSVPDDEFSGHVACLLQSAALTIRAIERRRAISVAS